MLKKLGAKLKKLAPRKPVAVDPSRFGDDLALQIEWTALEAGGSSFGTHRLEVVSDDRLEFKTTAIAKLFCLIFVIAGVGATAMGVVFLANSHYDAAFAFLIGPLFVGVGYWLHRRMTRPTVFDKRVGYYWKDVKDPRDVATPGELAKSARLEDVHALQIISELVHSKNNRYLSYELNLVLRDGTRVNVVDHGRAERLQEDARLLSEFLGKPVWDGTDGSSTPH